MTDKNAPVPQWVPFALAIIAAVATTATIALSFVAVWSHGDITARWGGSAMACFLIAVVSGGAAAIAQDFT